MRDGSRFARAAWRGVGIALALGALVGSCARETPPAPIEVLKKNALTIAAGAQAEFEASAGACVFPDLSEGGAPMVFPDVGCGEHTTTSARDRFIVTTTHDSDGDGMVNQFSITVTAVAEGPCRAEIGPVEESSWQFAQPYYCPSKKNYEGRYKNAEKVGR